LGSGHEGGGKRRKKSGMTITRILGRKKKKEKEKRGAWVSKISASTITHLVTMKDGYPAKRKKGQKDSKKKEKERCLRGPLTP